MNILYHVLQSYCESPEYGLQAVPLKFPITGAVFHVNPSFGLIYRHRWLILILLGERQNWHFACHIPFIFQHILQHTLSSFSAELLLRCRSMHSWMALCSANGTEMNKADKRTGLEKVTFLICKTYFTLFRSPSFLQARSTTVTWRWMALFFNL